MGSRRKEEHMRKTVVAAVVLAALAVALPAIAGTRSAQQRIRIEASGVNTESFVLTPLTSGRLQADRGALSFCCWTTSYVVRAGESLEVNDPHLTFTGAHGTLKFQNRIEWVDLPDGWSIFTGTWRVVGGTGSYGSLSGSGRVAGVSTASGFTRVRLFGFVSPK
jgi:hypothetical protein